MIDGHWILISIKFIDDWLDCTYNVENMVVDISQLTDGARRHEILQVGERLHRGIAARLADVRVRRHALITAALNIGGQQVQSEGVGLHLEEVVLHLRREDGVKGLGRVLHQTLQQLVHDAGLVKSAQKTHMNPIY